MTTTDSRTAPDATVPARFSLRVRMLSDWHCGTGTGVAGGVDRVVVRDPSGLPFIPATTLTGIVRDAAEQVASACDGDGPGRWSAWVTWLFGADAHAGDGTPRPAAIGIRDAVVDPELARVVAARPPLVAATTFIKPGVRLDRFGTAMADHLRFIEVARAGFELTAAVETTDGRGLPRPAVTLLAAATLAAQRIGGDRRRGLGRCRIELIVDGAPVDREPLVAGLTTDPGDPPRRPEPVSGPDLRTARPGPGGWVVVPLRIELDAPVVVTDAVIGNVVTTRDAVPGTMLLGPVLARLPGDLRAAAAVGDVVVTPATIEIDGAPGRPVPRTLVAPKGSRWHGGQAAGEVTNRLADPEPVGRPARSGWVGPWTPGSPLGAPAHVPVEGTTHSTVDDATQRPTTDVGGVYTYEAIAAGVRLGATLRVRDGVARDLAVADPAWWRRLDGPVSLGLSRKDRYGAATVTAGEPSPEAAPPVRSDAQGRWVLWALTDLVITDATGRPDPTAGGVAAAVASALARVGLDVPVRPVPGAVEIGVRRTDSWQVAWGLPRPSIVAVAAGSVIALEIDAAPDAVAGALATVVADGIGDRRAEGYGRISIGDPLVTEPLAGVTIGGGEPADTGQRPPGPLSEDHPAARTAETLTRAAWRAAVGEAVATVAAGGPSVARDILGPDLPSPSLLGALREQAAQIPTPGGLRRARRWLDRARNRQGGLLGGAHRLLASPGGVWDVLRERGQLVDEDQLTAVGDPRSHRERMTDQALSALIVALCRVLADTPTGDSDGRGEDG